MALTQKDLGQFEQSTRQIVKEEIKHLPTKDDFYEKMDEVMGELKAIREEDEVQSGKLFDHEDRITSLEKVCPATT